MHTNKTIIFTDGSSRGNPGPGGWAAIIANEETVVELGGREQKTTNNRMELSAVIFALEYAKKMHLREVSVRTDSSYVLNGATKWLWGWKRNNWKTQTKGDVSNKDLWEKMEAVLRDVKTEWVLVAGHVGVAANERCDEIATSFADDELTPLYSGHRKDYPVDLSTKADAALVDARSTKKTGKAFSYVSALDGQVRVHKTWSECEARVKGKGGARFKKVFSEGEEKALIKEWSR